MTAVEVQCPDGEKPCENKHTNKQYRVDEPPVLLTYVGWI